MRIMAAILFAGVLGCLILPTAARAGSDADPEVIAARCIERIQGITEGAVGHINQITARTVAAIEKAIANGDRDAARRAARAGAARVAHTVERAEGVLGDTVRRCARAIRAAGGDRELVGRVIRAGRACAEAVNTAAERCLRAIRAALEGGAGG